MHDPAIRELPRLRLWQKKPPAFRRLAACGLHVGVPEKRLGNSVAARLGMARFDYDSAGIAFSWLKLLSAARSSV